MVVSYISARIALMQLDMEVATTKGKAIKESTKKKPASHKLSAYEKFCNRYCLEYFPCDNTQLCRFGQHLSRSFESPEAVGNYMSGICTCLALMGNTGTRCSGQTK